MKLDRLVNPINEEEGYVRLEVMSVEMVENESGASVEDKEIVHMFGFNL